jgi:hypothetical protein
VNLGAAITRDFLASTRQHLCLPACLPAAGDVPCFCALALEPARLDGLTDRARGPPPGFPSSFDLRSYRRAVAGSSRKANVLDGYEAAPGNAADLIRPRPCVSVISASLKMLPFDIRHPSRGTEARFRFRASLQFSVIISRFHSSTDKWPRAQRIVEYF